MGVAALLLGAGCGSEADTAGANPQDDGASTVPADATAVPDGEPVGGDGAGPSVPLSQQPYWRVANVGEQARWFVAHVIDRDTHPRYVLGGSMGALLIYDGVADPEYLTLGLYVDVRAVWATSRDDLVIAGSDGFLKHWNATFGEWEDPSGLPIDDTITYTALGGNGATNVYVGTDSGQLWRFNGEQWLQVFDAGGQSPVDGSVEEIWVSEGGTVVVTAGDRIVWGSGVTWSSMDLQAPARGLFGLDDTHAFAVSGPGGGKIYRFDGTSWTSEGGLPGPALQGLNDVWGSDLDNLFAIGFKGTLLRYSEKDGTFHWRLLVPTGDDPYVLASPAGVPDDEAVDAHDLTLRRITGIDHEDILILAESGQGDQAKSVVLHYRRHPLPPQ